MKIMRILSIISLAAFSFVINLAMAQDDPGCKDHPMLTRMSGFYIDSCEKKDFEQYRFVDSKGNEQPVEGIYTFIKYALKDGAKAPSELQIVRNYANAVQKIGGATVFEARRQGYLKVEKEEI